MNKPKATETFRVGEYAVHGRRIVKVITVLDEQKGAYAVYDAEGDQVWFATELSKPTTKRLKAFLSNFRG